MYRNMMVAVDLYKQSFSDVNLIYNEEEKIQRYESCETVYRQIYVLKGHIGVKCMEFSEKKIAVKN